MITLVCLAALVGSTSAPELEIKNPFFSHIVFDANKVAIEDTTLASCPKKGVCIEIQANASGVLTRVFNNNKLIAKAGQVGDINAVTEDKTMGVYLSMPGTKPADFKSVACGYQKK